MENVNPNISKMKLSRLTLIAYGAGDFASNLCWTFIGSYLTVFYTDVLGIAPALASILIMFARIFDGIWDPIFGSIAERTHSKHGRFRPYILYGAPFLAIFSVLTFTQIGTGNFAAIMAFICYFICGLLYTVVNLSYGSLSTVMTTDQDDISQLSSYRMLGTNISTLLLNAITPTLLLWFSGSSKFNARGYLLITILFACCAVPLFYFTAFNCKENIQPVVTDKKVPISETIKSVLTNRPLILIFVMYLMAMTAMFGRIGTLIYYVMYNLHRFDLIAVFMTLPSLGTIIGIIVTKNYVAKVGKKKMAAIGYIGSGVALILMFLVGQMTAYHSITALIVINFIYGLFNFSLPIPIAMTADAINYQEDKTGIRSDGTSYATVSLATKLGSAFGASLGLAIMGATGYVANKAQTPAALTGINGTVNLLYGVLWLAALIPLIMYPLSEAMNDEINNRLTKKREAVDLSEVNLSDTTLSIVDSNDVIVNNVEHEDVVNVYAMAEGKMIDLRKVKDPATARGILGSGFAIIPNNGKVVSPINGQIINIFSEKHAIGISAKNGMNILIHMGVNTYDMKGKPFDVKVKIGQEVTAGQLLAVVDLEMLTVANKGTDIIFLVTERKNAKRIVFDPENDVSAGASVGRIIS